MSLARYLRYVQGGDGFSPEVMDEHFAKYANEGYAAPVDPRGPEAVPPPVPYGDLTEKQASDYGVVMIDEEVLSRIMRAVEVVEKRRMGLTVPPRVSSVYGEDAGGGWPGVTTRDGEMVSMPSRLDLDYGTRMPRMTLPQDFETELAPIYPGFRPVHGPGDTGGGGAEPDPAKPPPAEAAAGDPPVSGVRGIEEELAGTMIKEVGGDLFDRTVEMLHGVTDEAKRAEIIRDLDDVAKTIEEDDYTAMADEIAHVIRLGKDAATGTAKAAGAVVSAPFYGLKWLGEKVVNAVADTWFNDGNVKPEDFDIGAYLYGDKTNEVFKDIPTEARTVTNDSTVYKAFGQTLTNVLASDVFKLDKSKQKETLEKSAVFLRHHFRDLDGSKKKVIEAIRAVNEIREQIDNISKRRLSTRTPSV